MDFSSLIMVLYGLGSIGGILALFPRWKALRAPAAWLIAAGFAVHTLSIIALFAALRVDELSKGAFLQIMAWSLVFVYCVAWWRLRVAFLGVTSGPLALGLFHASLAAANVQGGLPESMTGAFFILHLAVLFLNLALMTLGMGSALFFLHLHRQLKSKVILKDMNSDTPALATVERINRFVVLAGFPLFTVGLVTGFVGAVLARGDVVTADPKEVVSLLLWLLYAVVFLQRAVFNWQGRRAALMLIVLFLATLLSLLGVNIFLDSHHNFFQTRVF